MDTLIIDFKNKEDFELMKELASRLDANVESLTALEKRKSLKKGKFQSEEDFRALGGIAKGHLISKEHLRSLSWKKRG